MPILRSTPSMRGFLDWFWFISRPHSCFLYPIEAGRWGINVVFEYTWPLDLNLSPLR